MANKRKRDDLSDSDSDEIVPGKQILPVANLPHDFDREPQDGMQYLFLVRRDARRLPHVTRVRNPYEVSGVKVVPTVVPSSTSVLPREEWRIAFQTHFSNLRKNLTQVTIRVDLHSDPKRKVIPERKDRDAWWKFLAGYPASAWNSRNRRDDPSPSGGVGKELFSPLEVTPSHLLEIDHRTSIHLLKYFIHWINIHLQTPSDPLTIISVSHAQWIFALLTKIEDRLSADEMNIMRNLARACLGLIQRCHVERTRDSAGFEDVLSPAIRMTSMSDASCWIIFTAIVGHWDQRDLWTDAETALGSA